MLRPGEMGATETVDYVLRVFNPDGVDLGESVERDALAHLAALRDRLADEGEGA